MKNTLPSFFLTKNKDIVFAIFFLPKEKLYIAFPKLMVSKSNTCVKINNTHYKKITSYSQWFVNPPTRLKKYLKYVEAFDSILFCFSKNDLVVKFDPLDYIISTKDGHSELTKKLIDLLSKNIRIDQKNIGVEGSTLLGYYSKNSDIDLFVYGRKNAKKISRTFKDLQKYKGIRLYERKDYANIFKRRKNIGFGNNKIAIIEQELRRFYGHIEDKKFCIINVLKTQDSKNLNLNRKIKFYKVFEGEIQIVNNDLGHVTPSILYGIDKQKNIYRIEIINHYGINQTRKDESFFVRGKMYRDVDTNENIIIIAFWNCDIEQRFDLLTIDNHGKQQYRFRN